MKKTIVPSSNRIQLYKQGKAITPEDKINLSLIALRKEYLDKVENDDKLKIFVEEFKKKVRTKPLKNISGVIDYWISGLDK